MLLADEEIPNSKSSQPAKIVCRIAPVSRIISNFEFCFPFYAAGGGKVDFSSTKDYSKMVPGIAE